MLVYTTSKNATRPVRELRDTINVSYQITKKYDYLGIFRERLYFSNLKIVLLPLKNKIAPEHNDIVPQR